MSVPLTAEQERDACELADDVRDLLSDNPVQHGLLEFVLDIRQHDHFSCGAAISMAVGRGFDVGPETLEEWKKALGTDVEESTKPASIVQYLRSLGLQVVARHGMTLEDLRHCYEAKAPVICCVQDYGPELPPKARFAYGHYVAVIGLGMGYVFCQDPSEDNVIADSGSAQKPGRVMISESDWMRIWHDKDAEGNKYVQYGIAVLRKKTGRVRESKEHDERSGIIQECGGKGGEPGPCPSGADKQTPKHEAVTSRAQDIIKAFGRAPAKIAAKAKSFAVAKFNKFEQRYGRAGAIAVMSASVALTPIPLPGTSLAPILIAEGVLHLSKLWKGKTATEALESLEETKPDLVEAVREFLADAYASAGEKMPEVSDEEIEKALGISKGERNVSSESQTQ